MTRKFSGRQYKNIETKNDYVNFYRNENNAREYAGKTKKGLFPQLTNIEVHYVLDTAKIYRNLKTSKLLDIATGSGRIIESLEKHFKNSTGIDSSEVMIALARKSLKNSRFLKAEVEKLPFKTEEFDVITCFRLLINIPPKNRQKMFWEIKRVLKNDGVFFAHIHINKLSLRGFKDMLTRERPARKMVSYFGIRSELEKQGFKITNVKGVNLQILNSLLFFLPANTTLKIDSILGKIPYINLFSDGLIIAAVKVPGPQRK